MASEQTTVQALGPYSRRLIAALIAVSLIVLYFGSFLLAEGDAYGTPQQPRDGFIHAPWFLGMPIAMVLGIPAMLLIERLWEIRP